MVSESILNNSQIINNQNNEGFYPISYTHLNPNEKMIDLFSDFKNLLSFTINDLTYIPTNEDLIIFLKNFKVSILGFSIKFYRSLCYFINNNQEENFRYLFSKIVDSNINNITYFSKIYRKCLKKFYLII